MTRLCRLLGSDLVAVADKASQSDFTPFKAGVKRVGSIGGGNGTGRRLRQESDGRFTFSWVAFLKALCCAGGGGVTMVQASQMHEIFLDILFASCFSLTCCT